jgi:hypothetical protein
MKICGRHAATFPTSVECKIVITHPDLRLNRWLRNGWLQDRRNHPSPTDACHRATNDKRRKTHHEQAKSWRKHRLAYQRERSKRSLSRLGLLGLVCHGVCSCYLGIWHHFGQSQALALGHLKSALLVVIKPILAKLRANPFVGHHALGAAFQWPWQTSNRPPVVLPARASDSAPPPRAWPHCMQLRREHSTYATKARNLLALVSLKGFEDRFR